MLFASKTAPTPALPFGHPKIWSKGKVNICGPLAHAPLPATRALASELGHHGRRAVEPAHSTSWPHPHKLPLVDRQLVP
jgi:hypothetical protein